MHHLAHICRGLRKLWTSWHIFAEAPQSCVPLGTYSQRPSKVMHHLAHIHWALRICREMPAKDLLLMAWHKAATLLSTEFPARNPSALGHIDLGVGHGRPAVPLSSTRLSQHSGTGLVNEHSRHSIIPGSQLAHRISRTTPSGQRSQNQYGVQFPVVLCFLDQRTIWNGDRA